MLLLSGCRPDSKIAAPEIIRADLDAQAVDANELNLFDDCEIIQLETLPDALIGEITKIEVCGNLIYAMDHSTSGIVFVFDRQGRFIGKIDRAGRGPNEYIQLTSFFIDRDSTLNLVSRIDKKLLLCDPAQSRVLGERQLPKSLMEVMPLDSGYIGYSGNYGEDPAERMNIWFMDKNLKIISSALEIPESFESKYKSRLRNFTSYNRKAYFTQPLDYNVYTFSDGTYEILYSLDFGKYQWPEDKKTLDDMVNLGSSHISSLDYVQETDSFLLAGILFQGQNRVIVYDKNTKTATVCELTGNRKKYFTSFGQLVGIDSDCMVTVLPAERMKAYRDGKDEYNDFETEYPQQIANLRNNIPNDISPNDNPFVLIYHFAD